MRRYNRWSIVLGGVVWLSWLVLFSAEQGPIATLLLFAVLVLVPLALPLTTTPDRAGRHVWPYRAAVYVQPVAALLAVASFLLPPGPVAALAAIPWLLFTGLVAVFGLWRLLPRGLGAAAETCLDAGLIYLPIGGAWLVLARLGARPLAFPDVIVLLTAVHFHYAGFVVPILAAMAGRAVPDGKPWSRRAYRAVAAGVVVGPPLLAVGFTLSPLLRLGAALILAASVLGLAIILLLAVVPVIRPAVARGLLGVSAAAVLLPMCLVGIYAVGEFAGAPLITIPQMAQLHGWLNALGFALSGLLAWTLASPLQAQQAIRQREESRLLNALTPRPLSTPAQLQMLIDGLAGDPTPARIDLGVAAPPFTAGAIRELVAEVPPLLGMSLHLRAGREQAAWLAARRGAFGGAAALAVGAVLLLWGLAALVPNVWYRMTAFYALLVPLALVGQRVGWRALWRPNATRLAGGAAAAGALYALGWAGFRVIAAAMPALAAQLAPLYAWAGDLPAAPLGALLFVGIVAGEEVVWRGAITLPLATRLGPWRGILLGAAIFAVAHGGFGSPLLVLAALGCGVYWGWLTILTRGLVPAFVCHLLWDWAVMFWLPY
jgi:membrane protease YdiL (CAAX protease family)